MATETRSIESDVRTVREAVGLWLRDDFTFVRITGADAAAWLHAQTTNDVAGLDSGHGNLHALLDRQGRVQAVFSVHRWEDEFWLLVERAQAATLLDRFEAMLFAEDVAIEDAGSNVDQVVVQGPQTLRLLARVLDSEAAVASELLPRTAYGCHPIELLGFEALAFAISLTGEDGYVFVTERGAGQLLLDKLIEAGAEELAAEIAPVAQDILRVEAGIPRFGIDFDTSHVIPETTLERHAVNYDKGCFPGQEVVARLRAYGSLKKALVGLVFEEASPWLSDDAPVHHDVEAIFAGGKKVGERRSSALSPTLGRAIAMAYLGRDHRTPGETLALTFGASNREYAVRVVVLPFVEAPDRAARAQALYNEALARFERDADDVDASAIPLLKEAILLQPEFEDAYEVLGVILHRHHRIDEAIYYMQQLERLNPNCLMAHTNLSVFYVAKGMIEAAEEEKAKAAVLGFQRAADERKAKEMAEAERTRLEAEARERIAMFLEVLEIDPDDSVATFGLGKAFIQLNQYAEAIPYLQKATETQKDFSAAYLNLGKCYEFLDRTAEAIDAYQQGIAAASRKGDLMPMREMERRQNTLREGRAPARPD